MSKIESFREVLEQCVSVPVVDDRTIMNLSAYLKIFKTVIGELDLSLVEDEHVLTIIYLRDTTARQEIIINAIKNQQAGFLCCLLSHVTSAGSDIMKEALKTKSPKMVEIVATHIDFPPVDSLVLIETQNVDIVKYMLDIEKSPKKITPLTAHRFGNADVKIIEAYCNADESNVNTIWPYVQTVEQLSMFLTKYMDIVKSLQLPKKISTLAIKMTDVANEKKILELAKAHTELYKILLAQFYKWGEIPKFNLVWAIHKHQIPIQQIGALEPMNDLITTYALEKQDSKGTEFQRAIDVGNFSICRDMLLKCDNDEIIKLAANANAEKIAKLSNVLWKCKAGGNILRKIADKVKPMRKSTTRFGYITKAIDNNEKLFRVK